MLHCCSPTDGAHIIFTRATSHHTCHAISASEELGRTIRARSLGRGDPHKPGVLQPTAYTCHCGVPLLPPSICDLSLGGPVRRHMTVQGLSFPLSPPLHLYQANMRIAISIIVSPLGPRQQFCLSVSSRVFTRRRVKAGKSCCRQGHSQRWTSCEDADMHD